MLHSLASSMANQKMSFCQRFLSLAFLVVVAQLGFKVQSNLVCISVDLPMLGSVIPTACFKERKSEQSMVLASVHKPCSEWQWIDYGWFMHHRRGCHPALPHPGASVLGVVYGMHGTLNG